MFAKQNLPPNKSFFLLVMMETKVPKTATERSREFRKRLKDDGKRLKEYKAMEKER